jgi:hypothetical protein
LQVEFTAKNSGGTYASPTFLQNPQWRVRIGPAINTVRQIGARSGLKPTSVRFRVHASAAKDLPINVKLVRTTGGRLDEK